jgi:hypothetical protein
MQGLSGALAAGLAEARARNILLPSLSLQTLGAEQPRALPVPPASLQTTGIGAVVAAGGLGYLALQLSAYPVFEGTTMRAAVGMAPLPAAAAPASAPAAAEANTAPKISLEALLGANTTLLSAKARPSARFVVRPAPCAHLHAIACGFATG